MDIENVKQKAHRRLLVVVWICFQPMCYTHLIQKYYNTSMADFKKNLFGCFFAPKNQKDQQIRNEDIMIKGISKYEQFKVVRTLFGEHKTDMFEMPVIKAVHESEITIDKIEPLNFKNLSKKHNNQNKLMLGFNYDSELLRLWNEPLKYVGLLQSCGALCTPDYSVYASMNKNDIQHNIYQNRWLGCLWQDYGCTVIPTISWATEETYDICFRELSRWDCNNFNFGMYRQYRYIYGWI